MKFPGFGNYLEDTGRKGHLSVVGSYPVRTGSLCSLAPDWTAPRQAAAWRLLVPVLLGPHAHALLLQETIQNRFDRATM